jgi:hypothetical protein
MWDYAVGGSTVIASNCINFTRIVQWKLHNCINFTRIVQWKLHNYINFTRIVQLKLHNYINFTRIVQWKLQNCINFNRIVQWKGWLQHDEYYIAHITLITRWVLYDRSGRIHIIHRLCVNCSVIIKLSYSIRTVAVIILADSRTFSRNTARDKESTGQRDESDNANTCSGVEFKRPSCWISLEIKRTTHTVRLYTALFTYLSSGIRKSGKDM